MQNLIMYSNKSVTGDAQKTPQLAKYIIHLSKKYDYKLHIIIRF